MEIKEAIRLLSSVSQYADKVYREALILAIAALEQREKAFDEWCLDCKEYDKEQHCCHRFTKVIRQAVEEHQMEWPDGKWTPVSEALPEDYTDVLVGITAKKAPMYYEERGITIRADAWQKNILKRSRLGI